MKQNHQIGLVRHDKVNLKFVKYLGMEIDLEVTGTRAHKALLQNARARNFYLLHHPGSPDVKINYIQFKILHIILATAKLVNRTLTVYQNLNKPFTEAHKRILALQ
jgi:hypothetical protein